MLGLLLGQIAVLSMERFFKAMPRQWIRNYIHPFIRQFLRCDISTNAIYSSNRTQFESIQSSTLQQCRRINMRMQIIIDSINHALLKLHNYDKELIKFEETFIGSAIILLIIFAILLTILLWLRRLSYTLSDEFPQNYKRHQPKGNDISQEKSVPPSSPIIDNLGEKTKKPIDKLHNRLSTDVSTIEPEINLSNNAINSDISMEKERVIEMKYNSKNYHEICKTIVSDSFNNHTDQQIKRKIPSRKTKRQKYKPILLFLSDELLNDNNSRQSTKVHQPTRTAKRMKRRYIRIL
ncbi:Methylated-thiol--corrinoid protein MtsB [Dirofilaria immitis]